MPVWLQNHLTLSYDVASYLDLYRTNLMPWVPLRPPKYNLEELILRTRSSKIFSI